MKIHLKPIAALCLAGFIAAPVLAQTTPTDDNSAEARFQRLQAEVNKYNKNTHVRVRKRTYQVAHKHNPVVVSEDPPTTPDQTSQTNYSHLSGRDFVKLISEQQNYLPFDLDVPGQAFVSTGPYVGVPIQFAGSNLIVNSPSVNTDLQLLGIRKNIMKQLNTMGGQLIEQPYHSHLLLSGIVEAQANYTDNGGRPSTTDIDVTNVTLDATVFGPSDWLTGFAEFTYDNAPPISNGVFLSTSNYRVSNSRVFINKAFITLGNLTCSPFYSTVGQFYVPFGTYSSVMVSDPLPKLLMRTKARSFLVGFQQQDIKNAFYGAAYIFRGDSHVASVSKVNNGGLNVGLKFDEGVISGNVGGGLIANVSDSAGMQLGTGFATFEQIHHRVPGYNARGILSLGTHIDLIGEFVSATKKFDAMDMSYNNSGAKPWAYDTEAAFSFTILDNKPSSIAIGFAKTHEALAVGVPLTRTSLVFNTSFFRNTLQSIEFRHDREYAASARASGAGGVNSALESGKSDNAVTAQFDLYF